MTINKTTTCYLVFLLILLSTTICSADEINSIKPGVVGYATQKFNNMSKGDRDKFALLLQCNFIAKHLGKDNDSQNYLVQAFVFGPPITSGGLFDTEIVSYFRGYADGMFNSNPDSIRKSYNARCSPLIDKDISETQKKYETK